MPSSRFILVAVVLAGCCGCQSEIGGSKFGGYPADEDVQYFEPGPEFKLSREAAARQAFAEDEAATPSDSPARPTHPASSER